MEVAVGWMTVIVSVSETSSNDGEGGGGKGGDEVIAPSSWRLGCSGNVGGDGGGSEGGGGSGLGGQALTPQQQW